MSPDTKVYTVKSNAVRAARAALTAQGISAPLSMVHFAIDDAEGGFTWRRLAAGKPQTISERVAAKEAAPAKAPAPTPTPQQAALAAALAEAPAVGQARTAARRAERAAKKVTKTDHKPAEKKPAKVAYRPKVGTKQGEMYELLTAKITSDPASDLGASWADLRTLRLAQSPDRDVEWTPAALWGSVCRLFHHRRGYGCKTDGQRVWLIIPADERAAPPKGGKGGEE